MTAGPKRKRSKEVQDARNALRRKGWSQRAAATRLGVSPALLSYVLTEKRRSPKILLGIAELPENPEPA
jgi:transcriptional regulator with XRE-family HTH domain